MAITDAPDALEGTWIGYRASVREPRIPDQPNETQQVTGESTAPEHEHSPMLRKEVRFEESIERARAHVLTLGWGELHVNGERIGDDVLNPAWTAFDRLALFSTYDVTDALSKGENAVGLWLGRGWFSKTATLPMGSLSNDPNAPNSVEVPQYPFTDPLISSWESFGPAGAPAAQPRVRGRHDRLGRYRHVLESYVARGPGSHHRERYLGRGALRRPERTARVGRTGVRRHGLDARQGDAAAQPDRRTGP